MRSILTSLALGAAFLALTPTASAQFAPVPNTGCGATTSIIKWAGTGQLGTQVDVKYACSALTEIPTLLLGAPMAPLSLNPPLACVANCIIALNPWVGVPAVGGSAAVSLVVPNNPNLIGARMRFQGVCVDTAAVCITATMATELTIN
jgi:hypothetical protein